MKELYKFAIMDNTAMYNGRNQLFIITGASRGIGKYLSEQPMFLPIYKLKGTKYCDISKTNQLVPITMNIKDQLARHHATRITLINCAGINYSSFAHKANLDDWGRVIDVNLKATFNMINIVLPFMRTLEWGRIINLSSVVGQLGVMGTSAYAASKAGLTGMIKSIACENASKNITINNLNLGYFDIGMIGEVSEEVQAQIKSKIPSGKFGNPYNIAEAIQFLIAADYVNGASIDINGGLF